MNVPVGRFTTEKRNLLQFLRMGHQSPENNLYMAIRAPRKELTMMGLSYLIDSFWLWVHGVANEIICPGHGENKRSCLSLNLGNS